ncbi:MAG: hypothetical protein HPY62_11930 [Bacteroidales bacterium]|nr:hypothetical protein [Bacteroidales bacterium]
MLFYFKDEDVRSFYNSLPENVRLFMNSEQWTAKISEIRNNTASPNTFRKRFFEWFNMFRIVKYLNFVHNGLLERIPVEEAAAAMLELTGRSMIDDGFSDILLYYRAIEAMD